MEDAYRSLHGMCGARQRRQIVAFPGHAQRGQLRGMAIKENLRQLAQELGIAADKLHCFVSVDIGLHQSMRMFEERFWPRRIHRQRLMGNSPDTTLHDALRHYEAVVFDLDGTLIDSYPAIAASVNFVRQAHGLLPLSAADVKQHVGRGPDYLLAHTVADFQPEIDLARYQAHHPTVMLDNTALLPGAEEALAALHGSGKQLGLCSNKPRLFSGKLLEHFGMAKYFSVVLGPEDVARPKPAPDMLVTALARLRLPADQVLYVGDMTVDIETARAAGVAVWVVPTGSDNRAALKAARPDRILPRLASLIADGPVP
jgi:2-phosphoglycolate phosphatase